jgi:hypothetical protein
MNKIQNLIQFLHLKTLKNHPIIFKRNNQSFHHKSVCEMTLIQQIFCFTLLFALVASQSILVGGSLNMRTSPIMKTLDGKNVAFFTGFQKQNLTQKKLEDKTHQVMQED